jgi:hypothetical protein
MAGARVGESLSDRGRRRQKLQGRQIELDERVDELDGEVEVFVRSVGATPRLPDVLEVIASQPAGTRNQADIDRQLAAVTRRRQWLGHAGSYCDPARSFS